MILTATFRDVENGWIEGRIKELPEVLTAAPTREQAQEDLADALHEYVASLQADGLPIPIRVEDAGDVKLAAISSTRWDSRGRGGLRRPLA